MKITRNTPKHLIVENTPWQMAIMLVLMMVLPFTGVALFMLADGELVGLAFLIGAAFGVFTMFHSIRRSQIIFDSINGTLTIRRRSLRGYSTITHALSEVGHAVIESLGDTDRIALVFPEGQSAGTHPLTLIYSNVGNHQAITDTINTWLAVHSARP